MTSSRNEARVQRVRAMASGRFAREIGGTFGATLVNLGVGAAQSIMIAREFGPSGKGLLALVFLLPGIMTPLLSTGFAASVVFFASRTSAQTSVRHLATFVTIAAAVGLFAIALLRMTGLLEVIAPDLRGGYLIVACLIFPLGLLQALLGALLLGSGKIGKLNKTRITQSLGTLAAVGLVIVGLDGGTLAVSVAQLLVIAVVVGIQAAMTTRGVERFRLGWDRSVLRQQLVYAAKDHPGTVLQFLNYRVDQVFVAGYLGVSELGMYTIAVTVAELLWIFPDAVANVVFPRASIARRGEGRRATLLASAAALVLSVGGAILLAAAGRVIITTLFSSQFIRSFDALLWLLPGAAVLGPSKILTADLAGRGYPGINSLAAALGLVVTVTLNVMLIPSRGIRGAAMASSASYVLVAALALATFILLHPPTETDATGDTVAPST